MCKLKFIANFEKEKTNYTHFGLDTGTCEGLLTQTRISQRPFLPDERDKQGSQTPHLGELQPTQEPHRFVLVVVFSFFGGLGLFSWNTGTVVDGSSVEIRMLFNVFLLSNSDNENPLAGVGAGTARKTI